MELVRRDGVKTWTRTVYARTKNQKCCRYTDLPGTCSFISTELPSNAVIEATEVAVMQVNYLI
jgi:hypothetical protein